MTFHLTCSFCLWFGLGCWVAAFWDLAAHSVGRVFVILVVSRFEFDDWIWILIASVPGLCIL